MPEKKKYQLIVVDDHNLFRKGLIFILSEQKNIEVIAEASNGAEFLEILKIAKPDLILMDINMPVLNGVEATRRALKMYPDLNIVVLSMYSDDDYYNTMIDLGVKGFLLKDADNQELVLAINKILDGGTYFSQELLIKLIKSKAENSSIDLTSREKEILELICKGYSNIQISDTLNISPRTVERHRASLLLKTESNNSISLVVFAIKHNLVKI